MLPAWIFGSAWIDPSSSWQNKIYICTWKPTMESLLYRNWTLYCSGSDDDVSDFKEWQSIIFKTSWIFFFSFETSLLPNWSKSWSLMRMQAPRLPFQSLKVRKKKMVPRVRKVTLQMMCRTVGRHWVIWWGCIIRERKCVCVCIGLCVCMCASAIIFPVCLLLF